MQIINKQMNVICVVAKLDRKYWGFYLRIRSSLLKQHGDRPFSIFFLQPFGNFAFGMLQIWLLVNMHYDLPNVGVGQVMINWFAVYHVNLGLWKS